jgi:hypothetical protein
MTDRSYMGIHMPIENQILRVEEPSPLRTILYREKQTFEHLDDLIQNKTISTHPGLSTKVPDYSESKLLWGQVTIELIVHECIL